MRRTTLSILGMYKFDNTIFDGLNLPASIADQKQAVVDEICLECAELELIYPDLETMRLAIKRWSDLELPIWSELQATREYEYNPIWNKDGTYKETETRNLAGSSAQQGTGSNSTTGTGNSTDSVKGFNETAWAEASKTDGATSESGQATFQQTGNTTDTGTVKRERVEQGNIGVTTTQQMIKEQREVVEFSTEKYIVNSFKRRFCLLVY